MIRLSPNDSKYLADIFLCFKDDSFLSVGFVSKLALCKRVERSDNPSAYGRGLVDKLISVGVLEFNADGRLVLVEDVCLSLLKDSPTFRTFNRLVDFTATIKLD